MPSYCTSTRYEWTLGGISQPELALSKGAHVKAVNSCVNLNNGQMCASLAIAKPSNFVRNVFRPVQYIHSKTRSKKHSTSICIWSKHIITTLISKRSNLVTPDHPDVFMYTFVASSGVQAVTCFLFEIRLILLPFSTVQNAKKCKLPTGLPIVSISGNRYFPQTM